DVFPCRLYRPEKPCRCAPLSLHAYQTRRHLYRIDQPKAVTYLLPYPQALGEADTSGGTVPPIGMHIYQSEQSLGDAATISDCAAHSQALLVQLQSSIVFAHRMQRRPQL